MAAGSKAVAGSPFWQVRLSGLPLQAPVSEGCFKEALLWKACLRDHQACRLALPAAGSGRDMLPFCRSTC